VAVFMHRSETWIKKNQNVGTIQAMEIKEEMSSGVS
jgi:hypothetical protein